MDFRLAKLYPETTLPAAPHTHPFSKSDFTNRLKREINNSHIQEVVQVIQQVCEDSVVPTWSLCDPKRKGLTPGLTLHLGEGLSR